MNTVTEVPSPSARPLTDPSPPRVLAILVTHSGREWLRDSLVALNLQTYPYLDVLVLDDASPDSKVQPQLRRVAKRHLGRRRWAYLRTPRPLGFGGAINWAMARVRTDADMLLFIHDDAALYPDAVARLVARSMNDENTAVVGPKIVAWDDPERLEEVGLAADRFGYPYKGLEQDEIDLGQHDTSSEVFYVSSTCMLVRHDTFKDLRGFDARMRAFSEDLDLCWRARVAGYNVRVEPAAKARHAIALAKGLRTSPFTPIRYFIRRNRLRAVAKNASGVRLLALIPTFILLSLVEMLGFVILRQPKEIWNLARALGWNVLTLPQTVSERARVQKVRRVPDRKLRRHTARQSTRLRVYLAHQAGRLEEAWGRRTEFLQRSATGAKTLTERLKGWPLAITVIALIGMLLAFRHFLWGPPTAVGELLPYPERATAMWRMLGSPWRPVGLGQAWPQPPAFALLGIVQILTFGAAGAAQKLLVLGLGAVAFVGAYRLVGEVVDRPARFAAGIAYALGSVGYAGIRGGRLGALVFGAAAPFVLAGLLKLTAWVRPPRWHRGKSVARVALGAAVSAAFVPGSLVLYLLISSVLASSRVLLVRRGDALRGWLSSVLPLAIAWALLLPWSLHWFDPGGPLGRLVSDDSWRVFAASYSSHGMFSTLLGQTPDAPVLFGLALPILGIMAVLVGEGQRRSMALALWAIVAVTGLFVTLTSHGIIRPLLAAPVEAGVPAAIAFSALAGLAIGSFRLDLPRRGLGLMHAVSLSAMAAALFLVGAGILPAALRGSWTPGLGTERDNREVVAGILAVFDAEVRQVGQFRTLWVGDEWGSPRPSAARPVRDYFVSGPRGQVLTDLFEETAGPAYTDLDRVVASIQDSTTDRGGSLLGAFNIRFVVLERGDFEEQWVHQRDLALFRSESNYLIFENKNQLPRASVYEDLPAYVTAIERNDPQLTGSFLESERASAEQRTAYRYVAERAGGPGVIFLAEARDEGWQATVEGARLERTEGGWGNAFDVPADLEGRLVVSYPRSPSMIVWLIVMALAWVVVLGAAFGRPRATEDKVTR